MMYNPGPIFLLLAMQNRGSGGGSPDEDPDDKDPKNKKKWGWILFFVGLVGLLCILGWVYIFNHG